MRNQPQLGRSLLDRLTDHLPEVTVESVQSRGASLNSLMLSVLRDLENLLNTRSFAGGASHPAGETARSILAYGSRDFSSMNPRSQEVMQQIRAEILRLLTRFEPRLKDATVRLDPIRREGSLNFRIEAVLQVESVAVPAVFDTCFDINSGSYTIHT